MTDTAWIDLEQNIIDTDVNEWRKRLLACVHIVGQHFKQFHCRQLKNGQLNDTSANASEILRHSVVVLVVVVIVVIVVVVVVVVVVVPVSPSYLPQVRQWVM